MTARASVASPGRRRLSIAGAERKRGGEAGQLKIADGLAGHVAQMSEATLAKPSVAVDAEEIRCVLAGAGRGRSVAARRR